MREILFRGKRVDNGKWVYGDLIHFACNNGNVGIDNSFLVEDENKIETFDVIPKTVGQYTGLTDKNGKKIFEGDILKNEYDDIETVEYFHNRFIPFAPPFAFDSWHENEIEIIGNVHDNSELLKGGAENA